MKTFTTILALTCLLTSAHAREWTSADGSKTFPADFISYNTDTKTVAVMKGFKKASFKADMLSEADQTWLTTQAAKKSTDQEKSKDTAKTSSGKNIIGDQIDKGILSKLSGKRFKRYTLEGPMPEYYLIHFSASW